MVFRQRYAQNKFGATTSLHNGIQYHSKKEAQYAAELDLRVKGKDIKGWERQIKISLDVNGYHIANYFVDFLIHHNDGTEEYVEVKGFETPEWKMKWRIFEALFSDKPMTRLTVQK